jgi:hypothetical protein
LQENKNWSVWVFLKIRNFTLISKREFPFVPSSYQKLGPKNQIFWGLVNCFLVLTFDRSLLQRGEKPLFEMSETLQIF